MINKTYSPQRDRPVDKDTALTTWFMTGWSCSSFTRPPSDKIHFNLMTKVLPSASSKNTRQFTFSFEGRTYENQGCTDFWLRGASVAAGLRHAVVSTQHQQIGQGSLCLLREANTEVNGLNALCAFVGGQTSKLWDVNNLNLAQNF